MVTSLLTAEALTPKGFASFLCCRKFPRSPPKWSRFELSVVQGCLSLTLAPSDPRLTPPTALCWNIPLGAIGGGGGTASFFTDLSLGKTVVRIPGCQFSQGNPCQWLLGNASSTFATNQGLYPGLWFQKLQKHHPDEVFVPTLSAFQKKVTLNPNNK